MYNAQADEILEAPDSAPLVRPALVRGAVCAESESEVARLNAEIIESRGQIRVLETDRASLQGEKSSAK